MKDRTNFFSTLVLAKEILAVSLKFVIFYVYCGIITIRGGQFSWFVIFLQVRGDAISWISWFGRERGGGGKGKITPEKFILYETSYFPLQWWKMMTPWLLHKYDLKMSTVKPLHANWVINTHNLIPQRPELFSSYFRKVGLLSDYWHY